MTLPKWTFASVVFLALGSVSYAEPTTTAPGAKPATTAPAASSSAKPVTRPAAVRRPAKRRDPWEPLMKARRASERAQKAVDKLVFELDRARRDHDLIRASYLEIKLEKARRHAAKTQNFVGRAEEAFANGDEASAEAFSGQAESEAGNAETASSEGSAAVGAGAGDFVANASVSGGVNAPSASMPETDGYAGSSGSQFGGSASAGFLTSSGTQQPGTLPPQVVAPPPPCSAQK